MFGFGLSTGRAGGGQSETRHNRLAARRVLICDEHKNQTFRARLFNLCIFFCIFLHM